MNQHSSTKKRMSGQSNLTKSQTCLSHELTRKRVQVHGLIQEDGLQLLLLCCPFLYKLLISVAWLLWFKSYLCCQSEEVKSGNLTVDEIITGLKRWLKSYYDQIPNTFHFRFIGSSRPKVHDSQSISSYDEGKWYFFVLKLH